MAPEPARVMVVGPRGTFIRSLAFLALAAGLALAGCSPDLRGVPTDYQLLVFPGEAELGGSAAAVINSNYIPGADQAEDYQLVPSRVGIRIKDANNVEWDATVRAVFPLAAAATSRLAQTRPGAWATVALFDLPTDPAFDLGTGPPFQADVVVVVDGVEQLDDRAIGSIRITGRGGAGIGGQPTTVLWPSISQLQLNSIAVRFRPVLDQDAEPGGGFPQEAGGTVIGGIQADLVYFAPCFTDPEAHGESEASDAGIYLGPEQLNGFIASRRMVLTAPAGFTLLPPAGGAPDALGEGPLVDVTFDRPANPIVDCSVTPYVWLWNVLAVRPDGSTIVDQRGTGALMETSDLFAVYRILPPAQ